MSSISGLLNKEQARTPYLAAKTSTNKATKTGLSKKLFIDEYAQ